MLTSRIPLISSTSTFTVATPNDRLTIVAKKGDVAVVSSTGKSYIMSGSNPALEASWTLLGGTPAQENIVAKGDILVGTDVKTFAPLTVGSNGQILSADSNEATGLKWTSVAGAAGAFPAYAQATAYKSGDTVRHNGGLFSANADIPANTVFTLGSMGVTWSPLITGVWSNIVAGRNQVVIPSTTGVTLQDTTGVYKGVIDSTGFSVKNGSVSRIAASGTFTFLASPTINKSAILLTDLETSMLDATGVPLINFRQGAVTVQGRSGVDSKIVVGDSGVVIHGPLAELGLNLEAGAAQLKAPSANSNLWLTSTNANLSGPVGVPNISLDATASILAGPNGDTETQVKLTDTDLSVSVGGSTNARLVIDADESKLSSPTADKSYIKLGDTYVVVQGYKGDPIFSSTGAQTSVFCPTGSTTNITLGDNDLTMNVGPLSIRRLTFNNVSSSIGSPTLNKTKVEILDLGTEFTVNGRKTGVMTSTGTKLESPTATKSYVEILDTAVNIAGPSNRALIKVDSLGPSIESLTSGKTKMTFVDTAATIFGPGNRAAIAANATGVLLESPTASKSSIDIRDTSIVTKFNNRSAYTLDGSGTIIESPTVDKTKVTITDAGMIVSAPKTDGTIADRMLVSGTQTLVRGPANSSGTLINITDADISARFEAVDKLTLNATKSLFMFDTNTKIDLGNGTIRASTGNINRLEIGTSTTTIQSGAGVSATRVRLTNDTDAEIFVNGMLKFKASSTAETEITSTTGTFFRASASNTLLMSTGGTERINVASGDLTIWGHASRNDFFTMNSASQRLVMGSTERLVINTNESYLAVNTSNYLTIQNKAVVIRVNGADRIWTNETTTGIRTNGTNTYLNMSETDINLSVGGFQRYKATTAESTLWYDSNNFVTAQSQRILLYRMGYGVFDAGSTAVSVSHDSGNKITFDKANVVIKSNNDISIQFSGTKTSVKNIAVLTGTWDIGSSAAKHRTIYATNALNTSSDASLKENIERLPDALLDSWGKHVHPKQYNWVDKKVDEKKHISFIAQDIVAAFNEAGVDWKEYGVLSGNGEDEKFGVVYTEAQIIETAYQRRKIARQEAKLAELEAKLAKLGL